MELDICMRCRKLIWLFVVALPVWVLLTLAQATELPNVQHLAVYAPRPTYPYEARAKLQTGAGFAIVTIDPATGHVTNAVMAPSTGSKILDQAALTAFRQWRFRPGTVKKVRIPIQFTLTGEVSYVHVESALPMDQVLAPFLGKENVIQAPMPMYPSWPPWTWKKGRGVYEIHVNKAGTVTEVKILKPSGDTTFDKVTVNNFHQWRLRNGPKIIELSLVFVLTPQNFRVWIP
jgi:TonB family protein